MYAIIYKRNNEVKVLDPQDAVEQEKNLLQQGWQHVASIDCIKYLNTILNNPFVKEHLKLNR
jgi:hypothetical protein